MVVSPIFRIRSGGQVGVDRGALDAARTKNVPIAGWCPNGGWAEDGTPLLNEYPELKETPSSNPLQRTEWNVRSADATIVLFPETVVSAGTSSTILFAKQLQKPYIVIDQQSPQEIIEWLEALGAHLEVNVAGPRASEWKNAYKTAFDFVSLLVAQDAY